MTPLREGGSLPGADGGRRPRHVRGQVPRRRPGPQGAGRRGHQRRPRPGARAAGAGPGHGRPRPRPGAPASRTRRCRTCCAPAAGRTWASTSCRARSTSTRGALPVDGAARWPGPLVRRAGRQRRTGPGATRTCCSGTAPLPDRPRRDADLPAPLGDRRRGRARPYDARDHVLLGCGAGRGGGRRPGAAAHRRTWSRRRGGRPADWLADEPGFDGVEQLRDAYVARIEARLAARASWLPAAGRAAARRRAGRVTPARGWPPSARPRVAQRW